LIGNLAAAAAGLLIVAVTLRDVFQGVIVPRTDDTVLRLSRFLMRSLWRIWPPMAYRFYPRDAERRENFLAVFAPLELILVLSMWVFLLMVGWGTFFYGIRDQLHPSNLTYGSTLYYAGGSLLTIGYGDILPATTLARMLSLVCAATGLGVVAIVISFLFAVFGSFQEREQFVVAFGARSGVPPSGVGLLVVHAYTGLRGDVANVLRAGQHWAAAVMETHLAYPILLMFRSSHDYESWIGTLGALMDASALIVSTLDPAHLENAQSHGQARLMYDIGRHLVHDFASYFSVMHSEENPGIERAEFDRACDQLAEAGLLLLDRDTAWNEFARLRSGYAASLNGMARWLEIPPVQWVGDRTLLRRH
jgi:hypothetical protein